MLITCSEFWNLRFGHDSHDRLHVRFIEAWNDACIEFSCLCSLELHLIDVTVLIPDRAWDKARALWEALNQGNHLRAELVQQADVSKVHQTCSAFAKVATLVQSLMIEAQLLQSEDLESYLNAFPALRILHSTLCKVLTASSKGYVDKVLANNSDDVKSEDIVLFLFLAELALIHE